MNPENSPVPVTVQDILEMREILRKAEVECEECDGTGDRATYYEDGNLQFIGPCEVCGGSGKVKILQPFEDKRS